MFLAELNHSLCAILRQTLTPLFATAFHLVIDLPRGELRFANAGHPPAFHIRRALGVVDLLHETKPGPALGIFETSQYTGARRPLAAGDLVMLYTDGLYEVESPAGEFYTREQLLAAVTARAQSPTPRLFDEVVTEIKAFAEAEDFGDDMCVVGVDVAPTFLPK